MKKYINKKFAHSGFSLMEMIVVLVIMGILTATLVPIFDTKKIKNIAAKRYANEILNTINAEQNYYMNNIDENGVKVYSNNLQQLIDKKYLSSLPKNPFYSGAEGELTYNTEQNNTVKSFSLEFNVPKDTVGTFFNLIPNLSIVSQSGNKVRLKTVQNIPGLELSLNNLMHRDSGVNQELRTSHGPIQITDNVQPKNSFIAITDDNTQLPENLKQNDYKNIAAGKGIIKMGVISSNNGNFQYGIIGGATDTITNETKLYINANKNNEKGILYIGMNDKIKDAASSSVRIGIGNTKIMQLYRKENAAGNYLSDGLIVYHNTLDGENKQTLEITHNSTTKENKIIIKDPVNNNQENLILGTNEKTPFIKFQNDPTKKIEMFDYSNTHMPVSFIGSIGGIYTLGSGITQGLPAKYIGTDCAGGAGKWKYKIMGVTYWEDASDSSKTVYMTTTKTVTWYRAVALPFIFRMNNVSFTIPGGAGTDVSVKAVALNLIKDAPSHVLGIKAYLYKSEDQYKGACKAKISYVKDGVQYLKEQDIRCNMRVLLICVPKNNNDYNS